MRMRFRRRRRSGRRTYGRRRGRMGRGARRLKIGYRM